MTELLLLLSFIVGLPAGYALSAPTLMLYDRWQFHRLERASRGGPIPLLFGTDRIAGRRP